MGGISMHTSAVRRRRKPKKPIAVLLTLAMAGTVLSLIAHPASADATDSGHVTNLPPDASPTMIAQAQAEATGRPAVVDALTTAYSQTTVNPDGTITESDTAVPTRVQVNGAWVSPDASLALRSDGTIGAKASLQPVTPGWFQSLADHACLQVS